MRKIQVFGAVCALAVLMASSRGAADEPKDGPKPANKLIGTWKLV